MPPSLMQQKGGGAEGLMENLMMSMEASHINWTFFSLGLMLTVLQELVVCSVEFY